MKKKKILILSMAYYPRFIGGAEVAIKELTDRLSGGYEFHLITLRYASDLPRVSVEGKVTVHRIGPAFKGVSVAFCRRSAQAAPQASQDLFPIRRIREGATASSQRAF
jgi:hypothetical protein